MTADRVEAAGVKVYAQQDVSAGLQTDSDWHSSLTAINSKILKRLPST